MTKTISPPVDKEKLLTICKSRLRDYPVYCVEYHKIKEQIKQLENEIEK